MTRRTRPSSDSSSIPRRRSGPRSHGWSGRRGSGGSQCSPPRARCAAGARSPRTGCGTSSRLSPGRWGWGRSARPPLRPHRYPVDTAARPVQRLRLGEPVEDQSVQPVPHASVLPLAQPPPRRVPGTAAQLRRQVPPAAAGVEHEQDPLSAARSSIRGRPPGPRGAARAAGSTARSAPTTGPRSAATARSSPRPTTVDHQLPEIT